MSTVGIGVRLKSARQARGLSLEDIEAATRIRRRYLEALEEEAFDRLPAPVYVKGFLGGYATYLGFSPDEIQEMYRDLEGEVHPGEAPVDVRITPVTPHSRVRRTVLILSLIVLVAAYFSYVAYIQFRQFVSTPAVQAPAAPSGVSASAPSAAAPALTGQAPAPVPGTTAIAPPPTVSGSAAAAVPSTVSGTAPAAGPSTPSASGRVPPPPTFTVTVSGSAPSPVSADAPAPTMPAVPPMVVVGPVVVMVDASDRSWVRAVADGVTVFEGFLSAGDHQVWQANHQLSLRVGNASAVTLTVNGQSVGRLGNPGDVVDRVFTAAPK